jgi:hypothetical protein
LKMHPKLLYQFRKRAYGVGELSTPYLSDLISILHLTIDWHYFGN